MPAFPPWAVDPLPPVASPASKSASGRNMAKLQDPAATTLRRRPLSRPQATADSAAVVLTEPVGGSGASQRGGGHESQPTPPRRTVPDSEPQTPLHELENRLETRLAAAESSAKTLLREALATNAEVDRAWQMLQRQTEPGAAQKVLLKQHIRAITDVVQQLTKELDAVELKARQDIAQLHAAVGATRRYQHGALQSVMGQQRTLSDELGRSVAELHLKVDEVRTELATAASHRGQLEQQISKQAAAIDEVKLELAGQTEHILSRLSDSERQVRMLAEQLEAVINSNSAQANKGNAAMDAIAAAGARVETELAGLDARVRQLMADESKRFEADHSTQVQLGAVEARIDILSKSVEANQEAGQAYAQHLARQSNGVVKADLDALASELRRYVASELQSWRRDRSPDKAGTGDINHGIPSADINALQVRVEQMQSNISDKLSRIMNASSQQFVNKSELKESREAGKAAVSRIERRLVADVATLESRTDNVESKLDVLAALLHTKTKELDRKAEATSYIVLAGTE